MEAIHKLVGMNLQKIRKKRGLSLDKVADLTGVSKAMLHQIERGGSQPTVTTVWKIATGLNLSFSALIKHEETGVALVAPAEIPHITEDNGRCKAYLLFAFDPQTRFEILSLTLHPQGSYSSPPHHDGVLEYITVVSGQLRLHIDEEAYILPQGHAIRFSGNVSHTYANETNEDVVLQVVMYYGES